MAALVSFPKGLGRLFCIPTFQPLLAVMCRCARDTMLTTFPLT